MHSRAMDKSNQARGAYLLSRKIRFFASTTHFRSATLVGLAWAAGLAPALTSADAPRAQPSASAPSGGQIFFNDQVRPILADNCFACHGFDARQRKADLRLDVPEGAFGDRDGVFPIKPGKPDESEVWQRIISDDPHEMMPPPASKKSLTAAQKDLIKRWIEQGAVYQKHWAFERAAHRPEPELGQASWPRNSVDRFILARLEREGLAPQPEADRATLIRRVAFALTGLPPTIAEVDRFQSDNAPDAYESMVERYLDSPRFGEEMARHWLDVARYADTHGLHLDNDRQMWAYRDWVIKAFNQNMPFDQFTIWQLAGDLLPDRSPEQLIATGFNRCNVTTAEGGAINEEWLYRYAVDRTSTMVQAWMGLTAGCAQCHDHKYDPLTMKDFYSLYAFFYSAADPGMDGNVSDTVPFLKIPTAEQARALELAKAAEATAQADFEKALADADYRDPADAVPSPEPRVVVDLWVDDAFPPGTKGVSSSRNAPIWALEPEFGAKAGRRALELSHSGPLEVTLEFQTVPFVVRAGGRLDFWVRIDPQHPPDVLAVRFNAEKQSRLVAWGDPLQLTRDGARRPGESGALGMGPVPPAGDWLQLSIPLEKLGWEPGARLKSLGFNEGGGRVWIDEVQSIGEADPATDPRSSFKAWWREGEIPGIPDDLKEILKAGPDHDHDAGLRDRLRRHFLTFVERSCESPVADLRSAAEQARIARMCIEDSIAGTLVFRDLEQPRDAFVMLRGQYDKPGDPVEPAVPAAFPAIEKQNPQGRATRLDLARWLLSPDNPLTARVTVNRLWQQLFGMGLVKTSYDFGTQGEFPSHPELLDWLALQFMGRSQPADGIVPGRESEAAANSPVSREGEPQPWDVKALVRLLVTSATFRQQARGTSELFRRDPENRLYARGPRFRLDAEQLRDNALFVSRLIDLTMGGRGVRPYQPPNLWEPVGFADSNTRYYLQDHGTALYRRSVYCYLKRTAPPPFMSNFDGPNREQFCTRRERSNTPLQALQLMNDVQQFEAARALAERAIADGGATPAGRIEFLYRTVLARKPDETELKLVGELLARERALFDADPGAARKAVHVGESSPRGLAPDPETAAWTLVANLILNLDETITRN
ncbi:MAG: DUF1553 domain-containing protein [Planctomycetaceae bacterium]